MARYSKAAWRPFNSTFSTRPKMTRYDLVVLHTMVGTLTGTESWFKSQGAYNGVHSHFGLNDTGTIWQWQDTAYRDACQLQANGRAISIETQDMHGVFPTWTGSDVPAWTESQLQALAEFLVWCHKTHGIPLVLVPDSLSSRKGIAYHRQGIDPWRAANGELWSNSRGKVCPGNRRIAQVPALIERAKKLIEKEPKVTREQLLTLRAVFRVGYYREKNPDLERAGIKTDAQLTAHWLKYGVKEGRLSAPNYGGREYVGNYSDLGRVFGEKKDYEGATMHYINFGINEGRSGRKKVTVVDKLQEFKDKLIVFVKGN